MKYSTHLLFYKLYNTYTHSRHQSPEEREWNLILHIYEKKMKLHQNNIKKRVSSEHYEVWKIKMTCAQDPAFVPPLLSHSASV